MQELITNYENILSRVEDLHPELDAHLENKDGMVMVRHPLIYSVPHSDMLNALLNVRFGLIKDKLEKYKQREDHAAIVMLHERPYRLEAFINYVVDQVQPTKYWQILGEVYTDSENIFQNYETWEELLFTNAPKAKPKAFMQVDNYKLFKALPDTVQVFRGTQNDVWRGFSWTLNEDKAQWFANRNRSRVSEPMVTAGKVKKSKILGYFDGRNESEVVCHFNDVVITGQYKLGD